MKDEKYVVFRRGDWEKFCRRLATDHQLSINNGDALRDAVVIRTHDIFATQGLWAYAHQIQTLLELTRVTAREIGGGLLDGQVTALEGVRDYFHDRAQEAEEIMVRGQAKLPD